MDADDLRRARGIMTLRGDLIIDRTKPFDGKCEQCGKQDDLRPYGAKGEWICFSCGQKDTKTTLRRMKQLLFRDQ